MRWWTDIELAQLAAVNKLFTHLVFLNHSNTDNTENTDTSLTLFENIDPEEL